MQNMFNAVDRLEIERRLAALLPSSARQWGKMNVAQMLAHCAVALEAPLGERRKAQAFLGRLLRPFILSSVLGEKPLRHDSPTDPDFVMADTREFSQEQARLVDRLGRFCERGPSASDGQVHSFFGKLSGQQWGRLVYKHLDHHLRQFGG